MSNYRNVYRILTGALCIISCMHSTYATTQPKFTLTPLTPTAFPIAQDEVQTVQYRVSNATDVTRTLTMIPIQGVTQITSKAGLCSNPFTLSQNESCILSLSIAGNAIDGSVLTGPVICRVKGGTRNTPDSFLCSQPSLLNKLKITAVSANRSGLFVQPSIVTLEPNGSPKSFTITNRSDVLTARNVKANFTGTLLEGNVTQDNSACTMIAPGQSCELMVTSTTNQAITRTRFPIRGDNTFPVGAAIQVVSPNLATISVSGSPLVLTPGQTGVLTITNESKTVDATNVLAHSVPNGVTQNSTCRSVAANGGTCTLSFTAGNLAVSFTMMPIYGINTSQTEGSISVNAAPLQSMIFLGGTSSITLNADGTSTSTLTIQNTSGQTIEPGVTAHFEGTNLNGIVTASVCDEILNNQTCTITFTAARTSINTTNFPIYGTNTFTLTGAIKINSVPQAYLTSYSGNNIYQCLIDESSKNFTQCQAFSNLGLNTPHGIVINPAKTRAYIANYGDDSISLCDIEPNTFNLINCESALANGLDSLRNFTFNKTGTIAYIPNSNGDKIVQCPVNSTTGKFDNQCATTSATAINGPRGIVIDPTNSFAYIANYFSFNVTRCAIDPNSGDLRNCLSLYTPNPQQQLTDITMDTAGTSFYITGIISNSNSRQTVCPANFSGCVTTAFGSTNIYPSSISINKDKTFDYVVNLSSNEEYTQFTLNNSSISNFQSYNTLPGIAWAAALLE